MKAVCRVKEHRSSKGILGFEMDDGKFYTYEWCLNNLDKIENLMKTKKGFLRCTGAALPTHLLHW